LLPSQWFLSARNRCEEPDGGSCSYKKLHQEIYGAELRRVGWDKAYARLAPTRLSLQ
jgi:hypothetical protein